ncbi:SusC/RagA family TonB-linked outer membrane protein [Lutibacter citreus]|uniref:SusC/RagA family TonB-linked outer membrane protein n=1 Tax=Lutibacter citreus TaxID=2138210 RepID=UPI000DBE6504|nr:TonB-dependent receptor [Lutibacter citreus]
MKIKKSLLFRRVKANYLLFTLFALLCSFNIQAQKITVKGVVSDSSGPMPGVTVLVQGTSNGTTTNFDGEYTINAKIGEVLQFSFLGMISQSLKIKSETLNVILTSDISALEEVVVIGYGTVKKKELTGAVTQVKAEDLEKIISADLGDVLQGQAAGVNVISSSDPGGASEILIRGITTLGDNTPLYVVDGIIQESDPRIAPSDIQTIDILKDAASTAIYGSRGATGVILITTKQGKEGSLQIRTNASFAIQHRNAANPLMNSLEQSYFNIVTQRNVVGAYDDDVVLRMANSKYSFQNETDLNDIVFRNDVPTQNYNTNISGGTKDITYNVSMGLFDQEGLMVNSGFQRFSTRANTVYKKNKLRIQTSTGITIEKRDIPQNSLIVQSIKYFPTQNTIDLDDSGDLETLGGDDSNRLGWVLNSLKTTDNSKTVRTNTSVKIDYELIEGLRLSANGGITTMNSTRKRFVPYQLITNLQNGTTSNPSDSSIRMTSDDRTSYSLDVGATYQKEIGDHKITAAAYITSEQYEYEGYYAERAGVIDPDIQVLNAGTLEMDVGSSTGYTDKLIGTIGRLQYDYKGKYLLSSSIRRDGSSKFAPGNKWGVFPSVAVAWNVSDENFWSSLKSTVNNFKVRASQGSVGNQRIQSYQFSAGIEQNVDYVLTNANGEEILGGGATQTSFANELLKWETTTQTNIGVDLGLFKNKLTISAEYYTTDKEDMLFPVILSPSAGGGSNAQVVLNIGNMTNKGAEISVGYRGKAGKVNYRMNGTFSTNKNEITNINGQSDFLFTNDYGLISGAKDQSQVTALALGHEAGAFYLLTTNGIIDTEAKLLDYQKLVPSARMGDVIFNNTNGDDKIDNNDRVYSGSGLPDFEIGYNFNANYKGFDFAMNWYGAFGQEIMNGAKATAYAYGRHKDLIYQWSPQNTETTIPAYRGDLKKHPNFIGYSDLWLEDGSYVRLKSVTVGYSLSKKALEKLGFSKLRFYVSAQNPFTITDYSGYNPEVGGGITARGLDKGVGPASSQYLLGLNFNF